MTANLAQALGSIDLVQLQAQIEQKQGLLLLTRNSGWHVSSQGHLMSIGITSIAFKDRQARLRIKHAE